MIFFSSSWYFSLRLVASLLLTSMWLILLLLFVESLETWRPRPLLAAVLLWRSSRWCLFDIAQTWQLRELLRFIVGASCWDTTWLLGRGFLTNDEVIDIIIIDLWAIVNSRVWNVASHIVNNVCNYFGVLLLIAILATVSTFLLIVNYLALGGSFRWSRLAPCFIRGNLRLIEFTLVLSTILSISWSVRSHSCSLARLIKIQRSIATVASWSWRTACILGCGSFFRLRRDMLMILKLFALTSLKVAFQLGRFDRLVIAFGSRPLDNFMSNGYSLVLAGMLIWPPDLESLSLISKGSS